MSGSVPFVNDFGTVLGVEGRSNGSDRHYSGEQNIVSDVYTGIKYQCVKFARRCLLKSKGLEFHTVPLHIISGRSCSSKE